MVTRTDPERVCLRHAESRRDIDREDYKYGFRVRIGKEPPTSLVPDTKPLIYMLCIYIYHSLPPIILSFSVWFWPSLFFSQSSTNQFINTHNHNRFPFLVWYVFLFRAKLNSQSFSYHTCVCSCYTIFG